MTAARAPWWMYVVAASFVGFFVFTVYADAIAPESAGAGEIAFGAGDLHLIRVTPGGAFDRAGIRNDDRIVAVDGDRIVRFSDWQRHRLGFRAGVPIALDVLRQDTGLHVRLTLHRAGISNSLGLGRANYFVWRSCLLALIVMSGFVFFRPDDVVAQLGALLLARFAAGSPMLGPVYGWAGGMGDPAHADRSSISDTSGGGGALAGDDVRAVFVVSAAVLRIATRPTGAVCAARPTGTVRVPPVLGDV
jgi:hypothetical protein